MTGPRRYTSLDGLRGICALVVVIHHALLVMGFFRAVERPAHRWSERIGRRLSPTGQLTSAG